MAAFRDTILRAVRLFVDDQGLSWAGAIGLYLFLSVPPLIVAAAYLGSIVAPAGEAESFVLEQVAKYLPAKQSLLEGIVSHRPDSAAGGALSVALLLFSGSRAFAALASAVNVMWQRIDGLTFWRRQLLRAGMLAVSLALLLAAALGEAIIGALAANSGNDDSIWLLDWQVLPTLLLFAFLLVSYRVLPREPVRWRHAALGAAVAAAGVRLAQAVVGMLVEAGWLETPYGDLAGTALLVTWSLVVGAVILFGAALTAALKGREPG